MLSFSKACKVPRQCACARGCNEESMQQGVARGVQEGAVVRQEVLQVWPMISPNVANFFWGVGKDGSVKLGLGLMERDAPAWNRVSVRRELGLGPRERDAPDWNRVSVRRANFVRAPANPVAVCSLCAAACTKRLDSQRPFLFFPLPFPFALPDCESGCRSAAVQELGVGHSPGPRRQRGH